MGGQWPARRRVEQSTVQAESLGHSTRVVDDVSDIFACDVLFTMVSTSADLEEVVTQLPAGEQLPRYAVESWPLPTTQSRPPSHRSSRPMTSAYRSSTRP